MLQIGIAGIGFMGMIHFLAYERVPGIRVAALYSRNERKLAGDWRSIQGNFGPRGKRMDLRGIRTYRDFDAMLADAGLDAIDICLPPSLHCRSSVAALRADKHVFCEKPIALASREATEMQKASTKSGKQLLVGHIVPFFPEYGFALSAARGGKFGKLLGGHFKRVIAEPAGAANYFNPREIGGPLLDLHIHDVHFIRLLFGMPRAVFSRGRLRGEMVEFVDTQYLLSDANLVVTSQGGVIRQPARSFNQAFEIHFAHATLMYDFAVLDGKPHLAMPLTVLDHDGGVKRPKLGSSDPVDGFVAEFQEVVRSLRHSRPSPTLSGDLAADALHVCEREGESVRSGRLTKV